MSKRVRLDKARRRLRKGESQRSDGKYDYRWTDIYGKRHAIYADTLAELRENAKITLVSATSIVEGGSHDVILKDQFSV